MTRKILALLALVMLFVVGLPFHGAALAGDASPVSGIDAGPRWTETSPADILTEKNSSKEFWIHRFDVHVRSNLTGMIQTQVTPIRPDPFTDGLGRKSVKLDRVYMKSGPNKSLTLVKGAGKGIEVALGVFLVEPDGDGERWLPRDDRVAIGQTTPIVFVYEGKVSRTLPDIFVRKTDGELSSLPIGKAAWVSQRLIPDGGTYLLAKNEKYSFSEFSDEEGGALQVKKGVKGELEVATDAATKGVNVDGRQPTDPALFDRKKYIPVTAFREDGESSPILPSRLRRRPIFKDAAWGIDLDRWPDGSRAWISFRDQLMIRMGDLEAREMTPWALGADEPFADEFGDAYGLEVRAEDVAQGMYGRNLHVPAQCWTLRLVAGHNAIYARAFGQIAHSLGIWPENLMGKVKNNK